MQMTKAVQTNSRVDYAPSVLMYSPDSIGLGHMRRNSAIAEGLVKELPGVSNLLLVGSSAGVYFDLPPGTDCVKLPSILKTGRNEWSAKSLHIPNQVARNIRSRIITETALALEPDVFLVDHVPSGIWDELVPTLKALKSKPRRPRLVLGLRDILGAPEEIRSQWERGGIYDLIDEYYDNILIYGTPDLFPAADVYGLSKRFADRISYCGLIHFACEPIAKEQARKTLGMGNKPTVVMTAGGGHDAFPVMQFVLRALSSQTGKLPFDLVVVMGPLMPTENQKEIEQMAKQVSATCIVSTPALQTYLAAADTVITMGGYNTVMESIAAGVPTIVIPRTGPSAEQRCRTELFTRLNLIRSVDLEWDSSEKLIAELHAALASPRRSTPALSFGGIDNAAKQLANLIRNKRLLESSGTPDLEAVA
jgi:predicted glycosyltransferase